MITAKQVIEIHELILTSEQGLHGGVNLPALEGALSRVDNLRLYQGIQDVYESAALYAIALARGHVFSDANKRTALVTALVYLDLQGVELKRSKKLEDIMVDVAEGIVEREDLADILYALSTE